MTLTTKDSRFDDELHLPDGRHRGDPPAAIDGASTQSLWRKRRAGHVAQHIEDALQTNRMLKDDPELHELADTASRVTEGRVHFVYTDQPDEAKPKRYKFQGIDLLYSRRDIISELHRAIATPQGL